MNFINTNQCIRYFERVSQTSFDPANVNFLVHQAFREQKELNLSWHEAWSSIIEQGSNSLTGTQPNQLSEQASPGSVTSQYHEDRFIRDWKADIESQRKMRFYNQVKVSFGQEPYLNLQNKLARTNIAKLRSSSHDLRIEKGRYTKDPSRTSTRVCNFCCDPDLVSGFESLPFTATEVPIIESEEHFLTTCPRYHTARSKLSDNLKSLLMLQEYGIIMSSSHLPEFGRFLNHCQRIRNPKKSCTSPISGV